MTKLVTIQIEVTEEQAALWKGRLPVVAPMTVEEWADLATIFEGLDGFVGQVAHVLLAIRKALETGHALPVEAMQQLIALTEDAVGASRLMGAVNVLMGRFVMGLGGKAKGARVQ